LARTGRQEFTMPRRVPLLLVAVLAGAAGAPAAEDTPRALIEKAVRAHGGKEKLTRPIATRFQIKGVVHGGGFGGQFPFTGTFCAPFEGRMKTTMAVQVGGQKMAFVQVMDGAKGWQSVNGVVRDLSAAELEEMKASFHLGRVTALVPLLEDKGFILAPLKEATVGGRPARGVKVSFPGRADTSLYFDKVTGLLVKYAYRENEARGGGVLQETVLSDYREPDPGAADEQLLKAAGVGVDGPALLAFLRTQGPDPARLRQIKELIRQLGADDFDAREKAVEGLVARGAAARPLLQEATRSQDPEVARRARDCLRRLGPVEDRQVVAAAVRLAACRQPAGSAEVLLGALPGAGEELAREIKAALAALAPAEGAALARALQDKDPVRRAAAAAALGKDGGAYLRQPGRRLYPRAAKQAMKHTAYSNGRKSMELEISAVRYYNRFEDKVFARP
jgi:hypothetical protein